MKKWMRFWKPFLEHFENKWEGSAERREPMGGGGVGGEAVNCNLRQSPEHAAPAWAGGGGFKRLRQSADYPKTGGMLLQPRRYFGAVPDEIGVLHELLWVR